MRALLSFSVAISAIEAVKFLLFAEYGRAVGTNNETLTWTNGGDPVFQNGKTIKTGSIKVWLRVDKTTWYSVRAEHKGRRLEWSQGVLRADFSPHGLPCLDPQWIGFVQSHGGEIALIERLPNPSHDKLPWKDWQRKALLGLSAAECDKCIRTLCRNLETEDLRERIQVVSEHELFIPSLIRSLPKSWHREELDVTEWEFLCALRGWDSRKPHVVEIHKATSPKGTEGYVVVEQTGRTRREKFYLSMTLPQTAKRWMAKKGVSQAA